MTDGFVDRVDDRLSERADLVDILIEIENPTERLRGRRDVVALGTEHNDGRANVAQVNGHAVPGLYSARREIVAYEQLIDNVLDFFSIHIDVTTPPALEAKIPRGFRVDLRIEIVLLAPEGVGRIEILKILHKPSAVKSSMAKIAGERSEPAAAHEPPGVAHGILTAHTRPIGKRRPGNDDRPEQFGPDGCKHHDSPPRLAIPNDTGFAFRVGMQAYDSFEKGCLRARHILNGLARHWLRQEPDEVARVPSLERDANFAVGLEATDARPVPRTRIDDNERTKGRIDSSRLW